jgi:hypothetical protein
MGSNEPIKVSVLNDSMQDTTAEVVYEPIVKMLMVTLTNEVTGEQYGVMLSSETARELRDAILEKEALLPNVRHNKS